MKWAELGALHFLWLLIPLALLLAYLMKRRERILARLFSEDIQALLIPRRWKARATTKLILWLLALAGCITALARPQWGFTLEEVKRRSMDIMVVLDTSNSMLAQDIKPNRLEQAKYGIKDLLKLLKGDRIGLVAFAGGSFLQCPLTADYAAFAMTLDDVYAGIIPRGGTAIRQALRMGMEGFKESGGSDRAIILITDGEDHEGDPLDVIQECKKENIKVFAIGVGTTSGELIPSTEKDQAGYMKNSKGEIIKTALREDTLRKIALSTGGMYIRSGAGNFGLDKIVNEGLSHLHREETDSRMIRSYEERFIWALIPAFILLLLEATLGEVRRKTVIVGSTN